MKHLEECTNANNIEVFVLNIVYIPLTMFLVYYDGNENSIFCHMFDVTDNVSYIICK